MLTISKYSGIINIKNLWIFHFPENISEFDILQKVFEKTTNDPQVKEKLLKLGFLPLNWGTEETKKMAKKEFDLAKDFYKKIGL